MRTPIEEVNQLEGELYQMQQRLEELQTAQPKPTAEQCPNPSALLQAQRQWQQSERDRLDEIAAIETCIPVAVAKIDEKRSILESLLFKDKNAIEKLKKLAAELEKAHKAYVAAFDGLKAAAKEADAIHFQLHGRFLVEIRGGHRGRQKLSISVTPTGTHILSFETVYE
jgi:chromosome segregation ATPase